MSAAVLGPERPLLTVCVLAYNDEAILARCLESLDFADEVVVVVDAKSTDGSEKIAKDMAAVVSVNRYAGDVEQKRHAQSLATNEWVLLLDSDEVVGPELASEICEFLATSGNDASISGCEINRLTFHLGRWLRHGDFYPDWKLRLYRVREARVAGNNPHGRIEVLGRVCRLLGDLEHFSYRDLSDQVMRIQRFSGQAAASLFSLGHPFRLRDLCARPPARFARAYFLKRGFLDGIPGLVVAVATAFHVFLKYAKLWELERERK
jgi:glycosyltransferase involved in cell wall biosynthesis